jgi:hypothetical protein
MGVLPDTEHGRASHRLILGILRHLGIPLNAHDSHIGQRVPHLGFVLDLSLMCVSMPEDRKATLASILNSAADQTSVPRSLLESLVGKLLWACQIMPSARVYLPALLALVRKARAARWYFVHLSPRHRHDIKWFARTIVQWDGYFLFAEKPWQDNDFSVIIGEACPSGGGCFTDRHFFTVSWCPDCVINDAADSQSLEIANSLLGVSTFGHRFLAERRLACLTDNAANVSSFARGRASADTPNGIFVTECIRDMMQYGIVGHVEIRMFHVARERISDADSLSRGLVDEFLRTHPTLEGVPPVIPRRFRTLPNGRVCLSRCRGS